MQINELQSLFSLVVTPSIFIAQRTRTYENNYREHGEHSEIIADNCEITYEQICKLNVIKCKKA